MIISIIQPCFVPWLGYFEQMAISDVFVYLDDVQYTRKNWRNSNRLKSPYGVKPIHVPVSNASREILINQALISYNTRWEDDLINRISDWYRRAPYSDEIMDLITPIICSKFERLVDLNYALNAAICDYLTIVTPVYCSSSIERTTFDKNLRILELCSHFPDVNVLYDGKSAEQFIDKELFERNGISVFFQDFVHNEYPQLWGDFVTHMSILDVLMNCGKETSSVLMSNPNAEAVRKMKSSI